MCGYCIDALGPVAAVAVIERHAVESVLADKAIRTVKRRVLAPIERRHMETLRRIFDKERIRTLQLMRGMVVPYDVAEAVTTPSHPLTPDEAALYLLNGVDPIQYEALLTDLNNDVLPAAMDATLRQTARAVGVTGDLMRFPGAERWIRDNKIAFSNTYASKVSATTNKAIRGELAKGWAGHESTAQLQARVEKVYKAASDHRAEMIVRTESNRAYSAASLKMGRELGAEVKFWIISGTPYSLVDVCSDNSAMGNIAIDQTFRSMGGGPIDGPPAHPNCLCDVGYDFADDWEAPDWLIEQPSAVGVPPVPSSVIKPKLKRAPRKASPVTQPGADFDAIANPDYAKMSQTWGKGLDATERRAFDFYQRSGFEDINAALRAGKRHRHFDRVVKPMDAAFKQASAKTKADILVWRGTPKNVFGARPVGKVVSDKAFMSTTMDAKIATRFAGKKGVLYRIRVPKGTNVGHIGSVVGDVQEAEILLGRKTKFRVVKKWMQGDRTVYDLEVIL